MRVASFNFHRKPTKVYRQVSAPAAISKASEPAPSVLETWKKADLVCFDVDSTFCTDESIDEIAAFLGKGEEVAELTRKAMGGTMQFQDALQERLDCMNVSEKDIAQFRKEHPPELSPGIPELVELLQKKDTAVALVSGGFRQIIEPIADSLGIPHSHVHANQLLFNADGSYKGFDPEEYTSRSGGKADAIRALKSGFGYNTVVMVGDGSTDMEARCADGADIFICYGGVVLRENVAAGADWVIMDINELLNTASS